MAQPFEHYAHNLYDFFSNKERGFYIPLYQRNYSWDEENAKKLIDDIFSGIKRTLTKPDNTLFLGTVILQEERNVMSGVHVDTPNLLTKVMNVVDGQQRIASIAMLACIIEDQIGQMVKKLTSPSTNQVKEYTDLATELNNAIPHIRMFYAAETSKGGANPPWKPRIIRAVDMSANPFCDQWTLNGDIDKYYRSNTSSFLANFIAHKPLAQIQIDERIQGILDAFLDCIRNRLGKADFNLANSLLKANNTTNNTIVGSLHGFMAYPPNLQNIQQLPNNAQRDFYAGMLLLAVCSFLKNACYFVVIECSDLGLAFDMFQSLNATGTPLTAFEVFKPQLVKEWGNNYPIAIKPQVNRVEKVLDTKNNAADKAKLTDRVIVSSALVFDGTELSDRFSMERDWLMDTFTRTLGSSGPTQQSTDLVTCIADQAEYFLHFIEPRKPNSRSYSILNHLMTLGLGSFDADLAALCIYYLRDANNRLAHSVLSVFYSRLLHAQAQNPKHATDEFVSVCKATAAFFTLYMGAQQGRFPDSDYKALFESKNNISFANGSANQNSTFVKEAFRKALEKQKIYDMANATQAKSIWVDKAKDNAWYSRKAVCRFALFVSADDGAPDLTPGNEGLFVNGQPNSAPLLNCGAWYSNQYEIIEHVATREKPQPSKYPNHFDPAIYPGNYSVVDKLGNLTLLSAPINSSIGSEWPEKVFYYWHLTTPGPTAQLNAAQLAQSLGINIAHLPPGLQKLAAASQYYAPLAPLVVRGQKGLTWDAAFIASRSKNLCGLVFDKLDPWLR